MVGVDSLEMVRYHLCLRPRLISTLSEIIVLSSFDDLVYAENGATWVKR
jgi:hypothetical protein